MTKEDNTKLTTRVDVFFVLQKLKSTSLVFGHSQPLKVTHWED